MGLWSWLFPSEADRLARARELLRAGEYDEARGLVHGIDGPEAEALYEEASARMGITAPAPAP
jgi:hypothetical protein